MQRHRKYSGYLYNLIKAYILTNKERKLEYANLEKCYQPNSRFEKFITKKKPLPTATFLLIVIVLKTIAIIMTKYYEILIL